jgi:hypothetical protein
MAADGTTTNALTAGGTVPPNTAATEEWNVPGNIVQTITTS